MISSLTYYYVVVRAFYQGKCQRCGTVAPLKNTKGSFSIHHKDGNKNNQSLENLEFLCSSCHSKLHPQNTERLKDKRIIVKRAKTKRENTRTRGIGKQFIDLSSLEIWEENLRLSVMTKDEQLEYLIGEIEKEQNREKF